MRTVMFVRGPLAGLRRRIERVGERGAGDARQEITAIEGVGHGSLLEAMPRSGGTRRQAEYALRMVTRPAPFRKPAAKVRRPRRVGTLLMPPDSR